MVILKSPAEMQKWRREQTGRIGFVPTMGALHEGHGELLFEARKNNDLVVLSIFVNPTQFNNPDDFAKYPITWDGDLALAKHYGVDAIFAPTKQNLYPDDYRYRVTENDLSTALEGAHRPGHFDGVLSVVMKLFMIVRPTRAYFGEKDFQQLHLIKGMADAFFMEIEVVAVATVRDQDGLALSSRNVRLSPEQRKMAPEIHRQLTSAATADEARAQLEKKGFKVDYVKDAYGRRLAAAFLGDVRLIDNVPL